MPEEIESEIGEQLRALYDEVVAEPIPESILELLKQLKAAATGSGSEDPGT